VTIEPKLPNGLVTGCLRQLVTKQVDDNGLVVWYDPEGHYRQVAASLDLPRTTIARYDGSFFKLRHEIDSLLNDVQPPRLVVYVPLDRSKTAHALIELEEAGVVIQPGQQPANRNTRLSVLARNALKDSRGDINAAEIEKQVEAGKLTLDDLNALGEKKDSGVLSIIFGTGNTQEVALGFLSGDRYDAKVAEKTAIGELRDLLGSAFGADLDEGATLAELRDRLTRHVLITDLVAGLGADVPASLSSVKVATSTLSKDACATLARNWRLRRDVRDSYVVASRTVEQDFALDKTLIGYPALAAIETFPCLERALIRHVESALNDDGATAAWLDLAQSRLSRFWSEVVPSIQAHWALIAAAAEVLLEADRVAKALKNAPATVPALFQAYHEGDAPWCLLDTHHRHMETRWANFEPDAGDPHPSLDTLILNAQRRYTEVGSDLSRRFVKEYAKAKHPIKGYLRQTHVFESQVKPALGEGKTAYVLVDALRYEMARELCEVLKPDFDLALQPALGTIPTITEVGMAALLPKADQGARVVSVGGGKLGVEIAGTVVKDRKDRIAFFKNHAGASVFDAKLDDLLPKPVKKVRDGVQGAELVLITSQEIDELCEADNITQARRQMDGVLNDLRRGFRVLGDLGVKTIVLAADHGYLFGEAVGDDMKIEAPGGETADLHRRVWVGVGGTSEPSYLRTTLKSLGVDSDLDIATPRSLACFKAKGGARAYFHGGLSLQELIIPVVVMKPSSKTLAGPPTGVQWTLGTGSKKLTTRFFSVQIAGRGTGLFGIEPPKVRVEIRSKGKCVSTPVSASYGFEEATGDVGLRLSESDSKSIEPNTVTLMITDEIVQKTVVVALLDALTGTELASMDKIEANISL